MKRPLILLMSALCLLLSSCRTGGVLPILRYTEPTFPEERAELKQQIDTAMATYSLRDNDSEAAVKLKSAGLSALEIYSNPVTDSEELISARKALKEATSEFRQSSPASDSEMTRLAELILNAEEKGIDTAEAIAVYTSHPTSAEVKAAIKNLTKAITG